MSNSRIRFYNARILDIETGKISKGELITSDGKIEDVGTIKSKGPFAREIDANNNLLIPTFKNGHSHSAMTILRASAENMVLMDWLTKVVFPHEAKMTEEDVYWGCKLSILEMVRAGIGATFDMYFFTHAMAKAFSESGFRASFCAAISGDDVDAKIKQLEKEYDELNSYSPLIKYYAGIHAEYTCSDGLLEAVSKFVNKRQIPFYTHLSEAVGESEGCIERRGVTPAELFHKLGLWNYGGGVYHAVHVTDKDIDLMKEHNISVSTNPCCNAKIASGIAPVEEYIKKGIRLGVGTDGPASNNSISMFKEMYMLVCMQRIKSMKPDAMPAFRVLQAATMGSAELMGLSNALSLKKGQAADLVMIDMHSPNMVPEADVANNLVYAGGNENVLMTMVNGKILYENGKYNIGVDPEVVYSEVQKRRERIFSK